MTTTTDTKYSNLLQRLTLLGCGDRVRFGHKGRGNGEKDTQFEFNRGSGTTIDIEIYQHDNADGNTVRFRVANAEAAVKAIDLLLGEEV
jgi:hypothetical protein